jgi:tRNA(Ile2) C34 agmatinyltransferase TiaS|tara:strand:+ start:1088 stop:1261 length:174 start_codon:yes stop_codon:yes gene_type:complete
MSFKEYDFSIDELFDPPLCYDCSGIGRPMEWDGRSGWRCRSCLGLEEPDEQRITTEG